MFDPARYGPVCEPLLRDEQLAELGPGTSHASVRPALAKLTPETIFAGQPIVDRDLARCCESALWLFHNFLDESHTISQEIDTPTGSYWHGIMHRREPDFGNAKYWFRRVGSHPVFGPLCERARELALAASPSRSAQFLVTQTTWEPFRFIDLCESSLHGLTPDTLLCRQIAQLEWWLLFDFCYRGSVRG